MAKPASVTLTCKECGYVNEPERVYCHNCGAKLDRSVLPKEAEIKRESAEKAQRRIKKMANPGASAVQREGVALLKTLLIATVVAALILMLREPSDAPPQKNELTTRFVTSELMELANTPQVRAIAFTEGELNAALKQMTKGGADSFVKFDRAYINLFPDKARIGMQQSIYGLPLHAGIGFRPEFQNGVFKPVLVRGNIGRLPVHPSLMPIVSYAFPPFRKLQEATKRDLQYLQQMQSMRIEKGRVVLVSKGTGARPAQ